MSKEEKENTDTLAQVRQPIFTDLCFPVIPKIERSITTPQKPSHPDLPCIGNS